MEKKTKGWVVVREGQIWEATFKLTRKESIAEFLHGSGHDWLYWKGNYGYKCVKAEMTFKTLTP